MAPVYDEPANPMDQIVVYLTASSHGVGQRLGLDAIDSRLRAIPLRQSLLLLSEMCFKTEQISVAPVDVAAQIELAQRVFPAAFMPRAIEGLRNRPPVCVVLSPQVLVLLGIRLMAVSRDDVPEEPIETLAKNLGALCLAFGDHVSDVPPNDDATILEFVRLGLFYGQSQHPGWLSLAGRLFFDVLPRLTDHPEWCDPLNRFEEAAGLSLERFWAITALQGTAASSETQFLFPVNITEHPIPGEELDRWAAMMSTPIPEAAAAAQFDISRPTGWSMTAVWKRPIVDFGTGKGPVLRQWLLDMQTEPSQMFWHVRDAIVEQGLTHRTWSNLYGRAVEVLGVDLLSEHVGKTDALTEAKFVQRWSIPAASKRADAAIATADGDLVVIDFVSRQFTKETASSGDFHSLSKDLKLGVTEKLQQVDVTLARAVAAGDGSKRIFPVVVLAGTFPMFPVLDPIVNAEMDELGMEVIGVHPDCRPWMALDLLNWMLLLRISTLTDTSVPDLLDSWQKSDLARNTFRDWALLDGPGRDLPGGGLPDDWRGRVNGYLGITGKPTRDAGMA